MENALLLGAMAMKIADSITDESEKKALLDMAGQSLSEAYKMNPTDDNVLNTYSRYYRAIGQEDKAWEMLEESQDRELLWRNYFRQARYQEAKTVLEQMLADNPTDSNSVLGLMMVSKEMGDIEGVKENSERLILLKGDVEDYLIQIQTFLEVGLVKEAELKLQSFSERFPDENRALLLRAWLMMRQGQLRNALEIVNLYLETNEESPIAWEIRGRINYLMTDYNQAINDFNRSRTLLNSPKLSMYLSKAYMRAERSQEAIIELQNAIEDPQVSDTARLLLEQTYKNLRRLYQRIT
jgi:tetratricopeptide (TPR) repeat protein